MKANEFVKKFGWDYALHVVNNHKDYMSYLGDTSLVDLKRIVESHELVESYGGLDIVKHWVNVGNYKDIQQAIADVESCK